LIDDIDDGDNDDGDDDDFVVVYSIDTVTIRYGVMIKLLLLCDFVSPVSKLARR